MTDPQPMRALVAGATGYTGMNVVRELRAAGIETVAHVRPDSPRLDYWRDFLGALGAQVDTTPWESAPMTQTMQRVAPTVVFALLGTTRARRKAVSKAGGDPQTATYAAVDYGLSSLLLQTAQAAHIAPLFVYLSAVGADPGAKGEYYGARVKMEAELTASGLPYIIARPSFITGEDREEKRTGERVGATVANGLLHAVGAVGFGRLRDRYLSLNGPQLGRALVRLAVDEDVVNQVFETAALRKKSEE
ncbi:MAG: NAD(P)H-binding protein [Candidatus Lernaella stagnicola]|nr:NAD(P)H-binding protein [Candidatus Lernaella stagnicola]